MKRRRTRPRVCKRLYLCPGGIILVLAILIVCGQVVRADDGIYGRQFLSGTDYGTAILTADLPAAQKTREENRSFCHIAVGPVHFYGSWSTNEFYITREGNRFLGVCAQPNKKTPAAGTYAVDSLTGELADRLLIAMMGLPGGELHDYWFGGLTSDAYSYVHALVGYLYSRDLTGLNSEQREWILSIADNIDYILSGENPSLAHLPVIAAGRIVFVAYNDDQDIIWVENRPEEPEDPDEPDEPSLQDEPAPEVSLQIIKTGPEGRVSGVAVSLYKKGIQTNEDPVQEGQLFCHGLLWEHVGTKTTDAEGQAFFAGLTAFEEYLLIESDAGTLSLLSEPALLGTLPTSAQGGEGANQEPGNVHVYEIICELRDGQSYVLPAAGELPGDKIRLFMIAAGAAALGCAGKINKKGEKR